MGCPEDGSQQVPTMGDIVALAMNPSIDVSTSVKRVVPIHKLRCSAIRRDPGGGGINVARVLRRFGVDVDAVYPIGGAMGQLLRRLVDAEGIRSQVIQIVEETRESFTVLEETTGQQFRFVLPGPRMTKWECRSCVDAVASLEQRPDLIVASGSLPPGIPEDFYGHIARLAKEWGARCVLDTSGPALKAALAEGVYLVKPNLRELSELVGAELSDQDSWVEACRALVGKGNAEIVALTLGDQGALLVTRDRAWRAHAIPIKPVSAVGAGDSFVGVMVWGLAAGHDLQTAFRYGVAAGTAALLSPGTELCRREDVERLYREVVLEPVGAQQAAQ
jgi:6-phosphofructokinase 2